MTAMADGFQMVSSDAGRRPAKSKMTKLSRSARMVGRLVFGGVGDDGHKLAEVVLQDPRYRCCAAKTARLLGLIRDHGSTLTAPSWASSCFCLVFINHKHEIEKKVEMPMPGYVFRDGGPIPDSDIDEQQRAQTTPGDTTRADATQPSTSNSSTFNTPASSSPSESHALANADHDDKGIAQQIHDGGEVRDLGWNEHPAEVSKPLVGGLPNEELWTLVRRFNKQMYHVKATKVAPPGGLDLNIVEDEEFSPDKLRSNLERLYMTVIIGLMGFGKHIARIRSWREPRRTSAFAVAYAIAWVFNFLVPLFFTTFMVIVAYPPSRPFLFPPAPLALVDSKTGGVQSPAAGVLGSHDSATGAPEKHQGEAVEQEASNFVSSIGHIALSSAAGKHDQGDPESDPLDKGSAAGKHDQGPVSDSVNKAVPDPTQIAIAGADAKHSAGGGQPAPHHDKTKQPMEEAMWTKMRPTMHILADICDGWERFANALSPTPPFPQEAARLRLAAVLVPALAISLLTTSAIFMKMNTLIVGAGFFSDPLIWRGLDWLNKNYPNWQKLLEIRNTLLKGVPTNAQLTVTLLRIGEANKAPLPPPPRSDEPPPDKPKELNKDELTIDASHDDIHDAIHKDPNEQPIQDQAAEAGKPKHHHGQHILNFFKGTTRTGIETKFGVDKARAKVGSNQAKRHLGVLEKPGEEVVSGPVDFKARYQGHKGWVYISTTAAVPSVSFSRNPSDGTGDNENKQAAFSVPVQDIRELKKIGGLGWKAKIVVGWATGRTVQDSLEIVDKGGNTWKVTAIQLREELFNRLIAMGGQKWDSL